MALTGNTCAWLVEVASGHPEPDSYADTIAIVECGAPVPADARHPLCEWHGEAMDMDEREFEALAELHDGHAFS